MVDLIQEFPGVVVTHDFFLSNIAYVSEFVEGKKNVYSEEVYDSHGMRGLIQLVKDGVEATRMKLPINWKIFRNAQCLISHSIHQEELMQRFYAHGWIPKPEIMNHSPKK